MSRGLGAMLAVALVITVPAVLGAAVERGATVQDEAIEQAARDYIDGWYEGDVERMERALHPDLVKRRLSPLPNGRAVLETLTRDAMVEYTRMGAGKQMWREGQVNEVEILDVSSHTATVKTVSPHFIDYLHLALVNDQWRIVNVLWEPAEG